MYRDLLFTHIPLRPHRSPAGNGAEVGATLQTAIWCLTTETENYLNRIQNEHIVNTVFQETRLFFFLKTQAELSYLYPSRARLMCESLKRVIRSITLALLQCDLLRKRCHSGQYFALIGGYSNLCTLNKL